MTTNPSSTSTAPGPSQALSEGAAPPPAAPIPLPTRAPSASAVLSSASVLNRLFAQVTTRKDESAAILESRLQAEIDGRKEERFYWISFVALLLDALVLPNIGFWGIPIFLVQLVTLIGLAGWLGVDRAVLLLHRIFDKYVAHKS